VSDIKIRKATIKDLKHIQDLNHWMCIRENKEFDPTIDKDYSIGEKGEKYFRDRITNHCSLVAIKDDKVIGYLVGSISKAEDYRTILEIGEAENMVVLEEHRGSGIGKMLLEEFSKWARSKNVKVIRVVATSQNLGAIRFYKREGFEEKSLTLEKEI
jgi:GNAT superfamily N-acetyltransferase